MAKAKDLEIFYDEGYFETLHKLASLVKEWAMITRVEDKYPSNNPRAVGPWGRTDSSEGEFRVIEVTSYFFGFSKEMGGEDFEEDGMPELQEMADIFVRQNLQFCRFSRDGVNSIEFEFDHDLGFAWVRRS